MLGNRLSTFRVCHHELVGRVRQLRGVRVSLKNFSASSTVFLEVEPLFDVKFKSTTLATLCGAVKRSPVRESPGHWG